MNLQACSNILLAAARELPTLGNDGNARYGFFRRTKARLVKLAGCTPVEAQKMVVEIMYPK